MPDFCAKGTCLSMRRKKKSIQYLGFSDNLAHKEIMKMQNTAQKLRSRTSVSI